MHANLRLTVCKGIDSNTNIARGIQLSEIILTLKTTSIVMFCSSLDPKNHGNEFHNVVAIFIAEPYYAIIIIIFFWLKLFRRILSMCLFIFLPFCFIQKVILFEYASRIELNISYIFILFHNIFIS